MKFLVPFFSLGIALWVFFDSQKHGYTVWQGLLWSIGVFFLLIIFLPLYLVARRRKQKPPASSSLPPESASKKVCFYCGKEYEGDPKLCPSCGQNLKI